MIAAPHPAQELFELRVLIKTLRAREAALRAALLDLAPEERAGPEHEALVTWQTRRVIVKAWLPEEIREDPTFYKVSTSPVVRVVSKVSGGAGHAPCAVASRRDPGEFSVIEPFAAQ